MGLIQYEVADKRYDFPFEDGVITRNEDQLGVYIVLQAFGEGELSEDDNILPVEDCFVRFDLALDTKTLDNLVGKTVSTAKLKYDSFSYILIDHDETVLYDGELTINHLQGDEYYVKWVGKSDDINTYDPKHPASLKVEGVFISELK